MKGNEKSRAYLYLILTFILWGSLYVVSKYILGKLPTFTISFLRFALAWLALTCLKRGRKVHIEKADLKYIVIIGAAGYFIAVGAQLLGTKYAGASLASLLNSLNPVTMMVFGALMLHERLTVKKVLGILLAIVGVVTILGPGGQVNPAGAGLSLFSVLLWSAVSVLTRRITQKYDSIEITRRAIGIAAVCYLPLSIAEILSGARIEVDLPGAAALLYMGIICTGAAYVLWNKSLSILEAGTCSAFYPVQPLVSALLGAVFLGERAGASFFAGAALIVAGVLISLHSKRETA